MLTGKGLVDEQVFFFLAHRVAEIHGLDRPTVALELVHHPPTEVLVVDRIVRAESGSVEVEHNRLVAVVGIVTAEIVNERRYLALEFDVKRFDDIEASVARLTGDNPVVIG